MSDAPETVRKRASDRKTRPVKRRATPRAAKVLSGKPAAKGEWGDYLALYRAEPLERIKMVKAGVSAVEAKEILGDLAMPSGRIYMALRIPVSTLNRKAKSAQRLSTDEGERIIGR